MYEYLNISLLTNSDKTKGDLTEYYNLKQFGEFDYALPQLWWDDFFIKLSEEPFGYVWFYPKDKRIEFPFPLTQYWEKKIEEYDDICNTNYSRRNIRKLFNTEESHNNREYIKSLIDVIM